MLTRPKPDTQRLLLGAFVVILIGAIIAIHLYSTAQAAERSLASSTTTQLILDKATLDQVVLASLKHEMLETQGDTLVFSVDHPDLENGQQVFAIYVKTGELLVRSGTDFVASGCYYYPVGSPYCMVHRLWQRFCWTGSWYCAIFGCFTAAVGCC